MKDVRLGCDPDRQKTTTARDDEWKARLGCQARKVGKCLADVADAAWKVWPS